MTDLIRHRLMLCANEKMSERPPLLSHTEDVEFKAVCDALIDLVRHVVPPLHALIVCRVK